MATSLLGQTGQCPTKNFQEKQFFLHKVLHSFSKTQQEIVVFTFGRVLVVFCYGREWPEDLANHLNLFTIHQLFHADFVSQSSKAFCILSVHIPACPTKFNVTLTVDQDRALSTMAIELKLPPDWF